MKITPIRLRSGNTALSAMAIATAFFLHACNSDAAHSNHAGPDSAAHAHHSTEAPASAANDMQRIMDQMMTEIHSAGPSGNADRDFAVMMMSHHRGAVEMAKAELATGKDAQMRQLAQNILTAQEAEIADMQRILSKLPEGKKGEDAAAYQALMGSMKGMMAPGPAPTGTMDKDFAQAMIPHHEGAVEMAKVQLEYGRDAGLRKMAEKMIADQQREIAEMKTWLQAHS